MKLVVLEKACGDINSPKVSTAIKSRLTAVTTEMGGTSSDAPEEQSFHIPVSPLLAKLPRASS